MNVKFSKIIFSRNKNTQIKDNQIAEVINNYFFSLPKMTSFEKIDLTLRECGKFNELFENQRIISSPIYRHQLENTKFEQIIRLSQLHNYSPVLRIYGCFTSMSSIRQKTESSDLAQLELLEKAHIIKFIERGYETKVIISLDENMIFSNNRYNVEQYFERCNDLINTLNLFKDYKNLKVVVDNGNNMESMYIFDTILLCYLPIMLFDSCKITYGQAIFDSELNNLLSKIKSFDERFLMLKQYNDEIRKFMNYKEQETFFRYIMDKRKNDYFNKLNKNV